MKTIKINYGEYIPENFTGIAQYPDGTKYWFKEGNLHREDGPAVEYSNGRKEWYKEGKLHRLDGPAIEYSNGGNSWYKEGKVHREDGPAREFPSGTKFWYIEDNLYSPEKLLELINSSLCFGKEKGQYNLEWLKFLTEEGIKEFPLMPGMKEYKYFKRGFEELEK